MASAILTILAGYRPGPRAAPSWPGSGPVLALHHPGQGTGPVLALRSQAAGIFGQLDLAPSADDNRRVLAVLAYRDS